MKKLFKLTLTFAVATLTLATADAVPLQLGDSIGVNFVGGRSSNTGGTGGTAGNSLSSATSAGFHAQANWNNAFTRRDLGGIALVDDQGASSGASVTWDSSNTWTVSAGAAAADGDAQLMNGYLDTTTTSTTRVDITGIPYSNYLVYLYFDGGSTAGRSGDYTVNGTEIRGQDVANWPMAGGGVYDNANGDNIGNYLVFGPESGAVNATAIAANFRGPLNAIQIVQVVPETGMTLPLLGLAFTGLVWFKRRK